jgi:hypothetical protein
VVTVTGGSFYNTEGLACMFGTVTQLGTYDTSTTVLCRSPASSVALTVLVSNNLNNWSASGPVFNYTTSALLSTATPPSGTVLGGTVVTVTGANFDTDALCMFGSTASTAYTYMSASLLLCATPLSGAAGTVALEVTNDNEVYTTSQTVFSYYSTCTCDEQVTIQCC